MFEAIQILKERKYFEKILPILVNEPKIFTPEDKLEFIKYWKSKKESLAYKAKKIDPMNALGVLKDLKLIDEIYDNIDFFLSEITGVLNVSFEELRNKGYKPLLTELGITEISNVIDLLEISRIKELEDKEIALEEYFEKYEPNTFAYFFKGQLAERRSEFKRALRNYYKALDKDNHNIEAFFRIGEIRLFQFKEVNEGLFFLNKTLELKPDHDGALIDMGQFYLQFKHDFEKAKEYNEKVIEVNPLNEKGYNNLGGCFLLEDLNNGTKNNAAKVEALIKKALEINPKYYDGLVSYGGFLRFYKNDEAGYNKYIELAENVKNIKDYESISVLTNKF